MGKTHLFGIQLVVLTGVRFMEGKTFDYSQFMGKARDSTCSSNIECYEGCCRNYICFEKDKCDKEVDAAYIGVGVVGLLFLLFAVGYFVYTIFQMKNHINKRQTESKAIIESNKEKLNSNSQKESQQSRKI